MDDNSHDKVGESMLLPGFVLWTGEVHVEYMVRGEADFRASYKHSLKYLFSYSKLLEWMSVCGVKVHFSVIGLIFSSQLRCKGIF